MEMIRVAVFMSLVLRAGDFRFARENLTFSHRVLLVSDCGFKKIVAALNTFTELIIQGNNSGKSRKRARAARAWDGMGVSRPRTV